MDDQHTDVVVPFRARDDRPTQPRGSPAPGRFCGWRGASGRCHVATVYPVGRGAPDLGLPDFRAFLLLAVARVGSSRRIIHMAVIGAGDGHRAALAAALAGGADEWHVHVLPEDAAVRAAMVTDLAARHGGAMAEARCA